LLARAAEYDWREIEFEPGHYAGGSETAWRRFVEFGLAGAQRAALAMLERLASSGAAR
jgi:hypothetical protein